MAQSEIRLRGRGRPTACTPEMIDSVCENIRTFLFLGVAFRASGINEKTGFNWRRRGLEELDQIERGGEPQESEAIFVQFYLATEEADLQNEAEQIENVKREAARPGGGKDAQWLMTKRWQKRWGERKEDSEKTPPVIAAVDISALMGQKHTTEAKSEEGKQ